MLCMKGFIQSERWDLNPRPPLPQSGSCNALIVSTQSIQAFSIIRLPPIYHFATKSVISDGSALVTSCANTQN